MKILFIIAKIGFRDEEYDIPRKIFEKEGYEIVTASIEKGECIGKFGMKVSAEIDFSEIVVDDYDVIAVIGGPGSHTLVANKILEEKIREFDNAGKIVSAICYAPVVLAEADILKGKKATVWNGDKLQQSILEERGAEFIDEKVVVDGNIITGNGPEAAKEFAEEIIKNLR